MTELKNRGVEDMLIAVVDGLKGFPDAITAVFPQTQVQTCIVHLIRNSLDLCSGLTRPHRGHGPCAPTRTARRSRRP
jgi:transposase-like protein